MTIQTSLAQSDPTGRAWLDRLKNAVIDLLFPPHCAVCHRPGAWLCAECLSEIEVIHPPVCLRCGLPANGSLPADARPPVCKHCEGTSQQLDGLRSFAYHSGPLRHAIHQFKYQDLRSLAGPLGKLMGDGWFGLAPQNLDLDVIVSVPLHPTRLRQRGFNQSALLARELGASLQWPVSENALIRTRATTPQVELGAQERRANVHNAFRCTGTGLSGQRVLLVDDVCSTGSTLNSACMALREADASLVWAYTLARARPGPPELR